MSSSAVKRGGFAGCVTGLTLDGGAKMNLNQDASASLGAEPGCPDRPVRVASFPVSTTLPARFETFCQTFNPD